MRIRMREKSGGEKKREKIRIRMRKDRESVR